LLAVVAHGSERREWNFTVYLDDAKIGQHRFRLQDRGAEAELHSEARFDVRMLFFSIYAYGHEAREHGQGDCLRELAADTDDNGTRHRIRGTPAANGFTVDDGERHSTLPGCVMTFAYWNPRMRDQSRLLNPQTGEYLDVRTERVGGDKIAVRGQLTEATRYVLRGEKLAITLWYSPEDRWLALDSVKDGRQLRYRIE
jgi:hypothetical protein